MDKFDPASPRLELHVSTIRLRSAWHSFQRLWNCRHTIVCRIISLRTVTAKKTYTAVLAQGCVAGSFSGHAPLPINVPMCVRSSW